MAKRFGKAEITGSTVEPATEPQGGKIPEAPPPKKMGRATGGGSAGEGGGREPALTGTGGFFGRTAQFLRDVRAEMRRVSWPSLRTVKDTTIITLIAVIFFAVYLFGVDQFWGRLIIGCDGSAGCGGHPTALHWLVSKLFG